MFVKLGFGALLALLLVLVFSAVRILRKYERGGGDYQAVGDYDEVRNVEVSRVFT
jgi:hypothetical protein